MKYYVNIRDSHYWSYY